MWHPWRETRNDPKLIVEFTDDLPSGISWWSPKHDVVLMATGLLQVDRRCALAHELGHRTLGHSGCALEYPDAAKVTARMEFNADGWAASKLISHEDLMVAGRWASCRDEAAEELWVTRHLLDVRLKRMHPAERRLLEDAGVRL